ncbi:MAG: phosphoribosyl-AMP cyclohydrolase [Thermomicrobiales bacterium]
MPGGNDITMDAAEIVPPTTSPPITFDAAGLVPAVIQDAASDAVLMVGFMDSAALAATRATGRVHFWSRSRQTLWRKGATSGHEQIVEDIAVNCDRNSLLIRVTQVGAVCHDGYASCYYRRLSPDDRLEITHERVFDPADVYGADPDADLVTLTRDLLATYTLLRDHDLAAVSSTSTLLRAPDDRVTPRLADELRELAGAVDGTHSHGDNLATDVALEASQALYWCVLVALRAGLSWDDIRPDRALATGVDAMPPASIASLLRADADVWASHGGPREMLSARCHGTMALVAQACRTHGVPVGRVVAEDLRQLRARPYLAALLTP